METKTTKWIRCPVCGNKTRDKIREDTVLKNYPFYCPKCKKETLIERKVSDIRLILYGKGIEIFEKNNV